MILEIIASYAAAVAVFILWIFMSTNGIHGATRNQLAPANAIGLNVDLRMRLGRYWLYIVFSIFYVVLGVLVAPSFPEYSGFVILAFIVSLLPTAFTIVLAVPIACWYIRYHKRRHMAVASTYKTDTTFQHTPQRLRIVARSTIITVFGIMSVIVSIAGINPGFLLTNTGFVLIIFSVLPAIFVAPSLNIASWLLTRAGLMYENRLDGTRINMGNELRRELDFILAPIALLHFIRVVYAVFHDPGFVIVLSAFILILSVPSAIVTVLLLRKKGLARLSMQLNDRLKQYI